MSLLLSLILKVVTAAILTLTTLDWLSFKHKYLPSSKPMSVAVRRRCHTIVTNYNCGHWDCHWGSYALKADAHEESFDGGDETTDKKHVHVELVEVGGCCSRSCCAAAIGEQGEIYNALVETSTSFDIPNRHEEIEHAKHIVDEERKWHLQNCTYFVDSTVG
jgi:hypothetical protein